MVRRREFTQRERHYSEANNPVKGKRRGRGGNVALPAPARWGTGTCKGTGRKYRAWLLIRFQFFGWLPPWVVPFQSNDLIVYSAVHVHDSVGKVQPQGKVTQKTEIEFPIAFAWATTRR
jgi:hypothetical protein